MKLLRLKVEIHSSRRRHLLAVHHQQHTLNHYLGILLIHSLNNGGFEKLWNGQNSNVIPSISASIKATIDPTDILVDAVHNFHPNYRHYTQTQMDEDS
ncbi:unnamed protein product [Heterobilharzia americana]|nr:unnamed protein product [Heterobilharzia americana]